MINPEELKIIKEYLVNIDDEKTKTIIKKIDLTLEMNEFQIETTNKRNEYNERVKELMNLEEK